MAARLVGGAGGRLTYVAGQSILFSLGRGVLVTLALTVKKLERWKSLTGVRGAKSSRNPILQQIQLPQALNITAKETIRM